MTNLKLVLVLNSSSKRPKYSYFHLPVLSHCLYSFTHAYNFLVTSGVTAHRVIIIFGGMFGVDIERFDGRREKCESRFALFTLLFYLPDHHNQNINVHKFLRNLGHIQAFCMVYDKYRYNSRSVSSLQQTNIIT